MFSFLEDIEKISGLPFEVLKNGFRIINFSNKSVYIENYKSIISFLESKAIIKMPKGILTICGKGLKLEKLNISIVVVNGEIEELKME